MLPASSEAASEKPDSKDRVQQSFSDDAYLASLEERSDLPEVQVVIRDGIRHGLIRVVPVANAPNRVRIVRAHREARPPRR